MQENQLNIGTGQWTGYEPFHLAVSKGIFQKNEVEVKIESSISEEESVNRLMSGSLDGATMTIDMIFALYEINFPVKAVLVVDYSVGGDMIIAGKGYNDLSELKGKKIGLEKVFIKEYFLARALAEKKISVSEIEIVHLKRADYKSALENRSVDAVVGYNPYTTSLLKEGFELVFSSKELPSSIIDLLVFPLNIFERKQELIIKTVQSWFDTLRYIQQHYDESIRIMAECEDVSEHEFKLAYNDISIPDLKENLDFFNLESEKNIFKVSDITVDFMTKKKMLKKSVDRRVIFDSAILKKIK